MSVRDEHADWLDVAEGSGREAALASDAGNQTAGASGRVRRLLVDRVGAAPMIAALAFAAAFGAGGEVKSHALRSSGKQVAPGLRVEPQRSIALPDYSGVPGVPDLKRPAPPKPAPAPTSSPQGSAAAAASSTATGGPASSSGSGAHTSGSSVPSYSRSSPSSSVSAPPRVSAPPPQRSSGPSSGAPSRSGTGSGGGVS